MSRNEALEAVIEKDPESDDGYLIYGDWLADRGDPRGELVALDKDLGANPWGESGRALRARRRELLEESAEELLGPLASDGIEVEWHLGFVRKLAVECVAKNAQAIHDNLVALFAHPSLRFVRELELAPIWDGHAVLGHDAVSEALATGEWPSLRRLRLGGPENGEWPSRGAPTLDRIFELAPNVEHFEIACRGAPRPFGAPKLRSLRLHLEGAEEQAFTVASALPALSALSIRLAGTEMSASAVAEAVSRLPTRITALALPGNAHGDELARLLSAPQLESLDLSMSQVSDVGAAALASRRDHFAGLKTLDVRECRITAEGLSALREFAPTIIAGAPLPTSDLTLEINPRGVVGELRRRGHRGWTSAPSEALASFESAFRIARDIGDRDAARSSEQSIGGLLHNLGRLNEAIEVRERIAARRKDSAALADLASSHLSRGRLHRAEELLDDAIAIAVDENDKARLQVELAAVHVGLSKWKTALALCEEALSWEDKNGKASPRTYNIYGGALVQLAKFDDGIAAYRRAAELEKEEFAVVSIELNIAQAQWALGRRQEAVDAYRAIATRAHASGLDRHEGTALANIGHVYVNWGKIEEAKAPLLAAIPLLERSQFTVRLGEAHEHLANVYLCQRDLVAAEQNFLRAIELHKMSGSAQAEASAAAHLAGVYFDRGEHARCLEVCGDALRIQRRLGDRWGESTTQCQLGEVHLARREDDEALACYERACELSIAVRNERWRAWNQGEKGRVHYARRDYAAAAKCYEDARVSLTKIGDPSMLGRLGAAIAALELATGRIEEARATLDRARTHLRAGADELGMSYADGVEALLAGEPCGSDSWSAWLARGAAEGAGD